MSLELRKGSRKFYSKLQLNGSRKVFPLETTYEGTPPPGLRMRGQGDAAFERSRIRAEEEEKRLREELAQKRSKVATLKRIHEVQAGQSLHELPLSELTKLVAVRKQSEEYAADVDREAADFLAYLRASHPKVAFAHQVTREMAEAFLRQELDRGTVVAKTVNNHKYALQGLFSTALKYGRIFANPFADIPDLQERSEHRRPYTVEQLERILAEASDDLLMYPLIVTGMSTAMRLGDCCCLEWSSINFDLWQIQVPACRKTEKPLSIPFFTLLRGVLEKAKKESNDSKFVFPRAALLHKSKRLDVLNGRFEKILLASGFTDDDNPDTTIRLKRPNGGRRASIRGFHSFRATWVTLGLSAGIPIEVIRKVTGHATVEVILEHYFHPDLAQHRQLIQQKMPGLIAGGADRPAPRNLPSAEVIQLLASMDENNWREIRVEIQRLLSCESSTQKLDVLLEDENEERT